MASEEPEKFVESLRQERLLVQKKTFTNWANFYLKRVGLEIDDLFKDMGDGLKFMKLLESVTGEKLGKPARGTSRINRIENVSRCLMFLHSKKMRLENISSEDIVDGKPHLILGLIWMIILRYEIPEQGPSTIPDGSSEPSPPVRTGPSVPNIAKESLMLWCQTKTKGYPRVYVRDFHRSWRDGLAFNALIDSHIPNLVDFPSLQQDQHVYNLENAFSIAEKHIGVPRLLDPEDVDTDNPDERSILVYVSTFCKGLTHYNQDQIMGKRIAYVLSQVIETEKLKENYTKAAGQLLVWIHSKVKYFESQRNLKSLEDIQKEIQNFKTYRGEEKQFQYGKKNEVEVLYFNIQMKRLGPRGWIPPESVSPAAIERAWSELQRAEHEHEINMRNQLKEQERLESLAYKFKSKKAVREGYINEIQKILTDPNYGASIIKQSDATFKKHEAIRTGIISREIMMKDLFKTADILIESNYREKEAIILSKKETEEKWNYVLRLLEAFDEKFSHLREVMSAIEEMDSIIEEMQQLQAEMDAESEPLDIESSLQKHALKEVQIASWAEAVHHFKNKVEKKKKIKDLNVLQNQIKKLKTTHENLTESARVRREMLEEQLRVKEHNENVEEILAWIFEKQLYCTAEVYCKDLASALLLQKNHKVLGSEILLKRKLIEKVRDERLENAILDLEKQWTEKEKCIVIAVEAYQYIRDAEEYGSWVSEKMHMLSTLDYGTDELTCDALFRRHVHNEAKIKAQSVEIKRLLEVSEKLKNSLKEVPRSGSKRQVQSRGSINNTVFYPEDFLRNCNLFSENISQKQLEIENEYKKLQEKEEKRKIRLQQSLMYFNFKDRCDEVEKWMREKEKMVDANDFGSDADEIQKHFEEFLTDMVTRSLLIDDLASIAKQLEDSQAEQAKTAKMLLEDVQRRWQHLNELTRLIEQNLKGYTSSLLANRMCESSITLLNEYMESENFDAVDKIQNFDDLRRKQETIERELAIAEERVKQALVLSENALNSNQDQSGTLQNRVKVLEDYWEKVQVQTKERQKRMQKQAHIQIFNSRAEYLIQWANDMQRKLRMREKISDLQVAQNVQKEHNDLGDEIQIQDYRFVEIEELGRNVSHTNPDIKPLLRQLSEAKKSVHELWDEKQSWISQCLDLQIFDREANHLQSICSNQNKLLDVENLGENLTDIEILMRHHDSFVDTLLAQKARFQAFDVMADSLYELGHEKKDYIRRRQEEINELRERVLEKTDERGLKLQQEFLFQEFKTEAQETIHWISEKKKRAIDLLYSDNSGKLSSKIKRLETLEAELIANQNRVPKAYEKGEKLAEECISNRDNLISILEELGNAWNVLCEKLEISRQSLYRAKELQNFQSLIETTEKKLDDIKQKSESSQFGNDYRGVKNMLNKQEVLEKDYEKSKEKVSDIIEHGQRLVEEYDCDPHLIKKSTSGIEKRIQAIEEPLLARREKLETCLKFHQFKSEVEREIMWITDQIILLSADTPCQSLLEAQRLQKKLENLEVTLDCHQKIVENLSKELLVLVAAKECIVDVTKTCELMEEEWNKLLGIFYDKKAKTNFTVKAQMFYTEATEIASWISEKKQMLSSTDYGNNEDMIIKLLTKQKDTELEIDSYKGLVEELAHQAESLIELKHPDFKIIKNRMETIEQDMKNIQNLCLTRRQKLLEAKTEREFEKETEELDVWIDEQMSEANSEDFGEDYEHILILYSKFEYFRTRVEAGSRRILQYEEFARRLINSNCPFTDKVNKSLDHLSAKWSELLESLDARGFKLEAASEIHRYHRDVNDVLERITTHYRSIPTDLGSSLAQAQQLAKNHDATENELIVLEAQVHVLVETSQKLIETYPGGNEEHIRMQSQLVIDNWNSLSQKIASRKENLIAAQRIHKFFALVREEETWSKQMCFELESDNVPRDLEQIENQHEITEIEINARLSRYEAIKDDGESLLVHNLFQKQIREKLETLTEIEAKVKKAWEKRCSLIERTKAVISFFNEAKQIQSSLATREVQLCGTETKETVEDLECALKKHLDFKKTIKAQSEKFESWEQQGKELLKQRSPESDRIEKKLEDLSKRRKRLVNFSNERCESYSNSLRLAKFKRDIIEVEAWIKEKKNRLRVLLKDYNLLTADEKIKCLQKQQSIQAEIEAHEPIIQRIIQQKKEVTSAGEELNVRVEMILDNWKEVKGNADRIGQDLKEAQDMLIMHDYFEKAEAWIKEKELLIQKNDSGKDYEHCVSLQMKLDDNNSGSKIDDAFIHKMRVLAEKLSRKENQNGVNVRFERISERWDYLKEEMALYRKKLNNAAEVHAFIKDMDDTIDRIREKSMFLSAREEVYELAAAEMIRRKLEDVEKDFTAIAKKLKEQFYQGDYLSEQHELSAGRIHDKMNQADREWKELQKELERKKNHINAVYMSLKYVKDVDDMETFVSDIIKEMEYGETPSDSADAISFLNAHQHSKAQIATCQEKIKALEKRGEEVLKTPGVLVEEIENSIGTLSQMSESIEMSWNYRLNLLTKLRDVHKFSEKAKQIETWFVSKEAFLANEDFGDSLSSVEALIRKHENFEKTCTSYFEKFQELELLIKEIREYKDCQDIENWFVEICSRRDRFLDACQNRRKTLDDSKALQQMLQHLYEVTNWMNEKIKLVSDESFNDLTNLLSKNKKIATLEAEISANHPRIVSITSQAGEMLENSHFASEEIMRHIQNLEDLWQKLLDLTNKQKLKLSNASNALKIKQKLQDINNWIEETESQLQFKNYNLDVLSIQQEIDKLQDLEKDLEEIGRKFRTLREESETMDPSSKENILSEFETTEQRMRAVDDEIALLNDKLAEELTLASLEKDVNDELSWIEENIVVCQSEELLDNINSVQILQKKLQGLETETLSREPLINSLVERGKSINSTKADEISRHLKRKFEELKDAIGLRRLRLNDALVLQEYYFEVAQADIWMKEKMAQISTAEECADIFSAHEMKRKVIAVEAAVNGYRQNIDSLEEFSSTLIGKNHYDAFNIRAKQDELNSRYEELTCNVLKKIAVLQEEEEFYSYQRDVKTLISQLKDMTARANNTDVGRDAEHTESLMQKLELLRSRLCTHGKTVKELQQKANSLIDGGHINADKIQKLLSDLEDAWLECDISAENQYKVLEQAKLLHSFRMSAEETISWIHEKEFGFSSDNYGQDLQSIGTLLRHHETLERDLKAIQQQIVALHDEACCLSEQFPDSKEAIEKYSDVVKEFEDCLIKAEERKEKLLQAQQLQSYFDEARDFQAWFNQMLALMSQVDKPQDLAACETLFVHHEECKLDIDSQVQYFKAYENRGRDIIKSGHFMSSDIESKLENLNTSFENISRMWEDKRRIIEENMELQQLKKKLEELDIWLQTQEYCLREEDGRSVEEVENLIRKHERFEEKLQLYEAKFQEVLQLTKIEQELRNKMAVEERNRDEEMKLEKQRKVEEIKRKEEERLMQERQREKELLEMSQQSLSDNDMNPEDNSPQKKQYFERLPDRRSKRSIYTTSRKSSPVPPDVARPTMAEGYLHRKQETAAGGKRATSRNWKNYYTVLCGQLLCFFKDQKTSVNPKAKAAKGPINIFGARCSVAEDYRKKKFVFRLEPTDHSSFLFEAPSEIKLNEWVRKIQYTAALHPSMQLTLASNRSASVMEDRRYSVAENDAWSDDEESTYRRAERFSFADDPIYDDSGAVIGSVSNPIYEDLRSERSDTLTHDDDTIQSNRSSLSSYRTAHAGSSTSTIQNFNSNLSLEDEAAYSVPELPARTRSEMNVGPQEHEMAKKAQSMPRGIDTGAPKKKKRPFSTFSLRRNK